MSARVVVAGGTGLTGRAVVRALERRGLTPVVLARATGADLTTGAGVDAALAGADAVIDVLSTPGTDGTEVGEFFARTTGVLTGAGARAGVGVHVALSIVGIDRAEGSGHHAGKRRQEEAVAAGPVPWTVLRATQFHDFAAQVVGWVARDGVAPVPPVPLQPVDLGDVAEALVDAALAPAAGLLPDLAGPEVLGLDDMARRLVAARGDAVEVVTSWDAGLFPRGDDPSARLPGPGATIAAGTFAGWLAEKF